MNFHRMLIPILLLVTLAACQEAIDPDVQERTSNYEIIGGNVFDGMPAVGSIVVNRSHSCTGTLISPRRVLTAAHCVHGIDPSTMLFVIGPRLSQAEAIIPVVAAVAHPNYNPRTIANDIGYIDLASDAPVTPMKIVTQIDSSWIGRELFFVGYGANNGFSQTGSGIKRSTSIAINQVGATQFAYAGSSTNTCNGDSGGPAFWYDSVSQRFLLAGVTSYGDRNCTQYGVDTRVDVYQDFFALAPIVVAPVDPCGGESFEGRCDGLELIWCENEEISSLTCASGCGFQSGRGIFNCQ